ncbi:hypothetical protein H0H93_008234, partial [Arthromyces matolae]
ETPKQQTDPEQIGLKLPCGKFDAALPEGYVPIKREIKEFDFSRLDYSDMDYIFTTLPMRFNNDTVAIGANGWTECLLKGGKHKRWILSIPGFPHSVPSFDPPRYRIGPSVHGGKGLFATCDIPLGDLIFAERPLMIDPRMHQLVPIQDNPGISQAEMIKIHLTECERLLENCVERMLPQDREAFFDLWDSHTEDGSGPILGRVRTNGMGIRIGENEEGCIPNVSWFFDQPSFSLRFHALRPIKSGDELFIAYVDVTIPKAQRQSLLVPYGFECNCSGCSDPTYEERLASIGKSWVAGDQPVGSPGTILKKSVRWIKIIEDSGLQAHVNYLAHLAIVFTTFDVLGNPEMAKRYHELMQKMRFVTGRIKACDV